jgi:uncharacterized protein YjbI with pentapeptide repeats
MATDITRTTLTQTELIEIINRATGPVWLPYTDLSGLNLSGAYLYGANLRGADLRGANLEGANLRKATLCAAVFGKDSENDPVANLHKADLRGANLSAIGLGEKDDKGEEKKVKTNLRGVNLSEANCRYANLEDADLTGANLQKAALADAYLYEAILDGANLTEANLSQFKMPTASEIADAKAIKERKEAEEKQASEEQQKGEEKKEGPITRSQEALYRRVHRLAEATFKGAILDKTDLRRTLWLEVDLTETSLQKADLRGANLREATLTTLEPSAEGGDALPSGPKANFKGAKYNEGKDGTKWPEGFMPRDEGAIPEGEDKESRAGEIAGEPPPDGGPPPAPSMEEYKQQMP